MINLISAIYDHAVEQMETIDETIQAYNERIAALQRERNALDQLYAVAVAYRKSTGPSSVSGVVTGGSVNNVPRPISVHDPYISRSGKDDTASQHNGVVSAVETTPATQNQIIQSFSQNYSLF